MFFIYSYTLLIILSFEQITGCTIIFTTHNMDEADYLSDQIVVIQKGRLKVCGSPSSLREKYTHGYELTLTKLVSVYDFPIKHHLSWKSMHNTKCILT